MKGFKLRGIGDNHGVWPIPGRLFGQNRHRPVGSQADDLEFAIQVIDDVQCVAADRTGRSDNRDTLHFFVTDSLGLHRTKSSSK